MNKRIKELETLCWTHVPCDFDMAADGLSTVKTVFDREKFAQLVVNECAEIAIKSGSISNKSIQAKAESEGIYHKIKEAFGVE